MGRTSITRRSSPSRTLSERTGFDVRLKAELFQRTGSYKIRGPLNKFPQLTDEQKRRGVICSSAGNHAQGVALAARITASRPSSCMAENATPSKIEATRAYGAEVVLHGSIWDEANEKAKQLVAERGYTYIHPFDDEQLIVGQGTVGLEIAQDWPEVDVVVVPIGGGGLISGVAMAVKAFNPEDPRDRRRVVRRAGHDSAASRGPRRHARSRGLHHRRPAREARRREDLRDRPRVRRRDRRRCPTSRSSTPSCGRCTTRSWCRKARRRRPSRRCCTASSRRRRIAGRRASSVGGNVNLDQLKGLRWN